MSTQPAPQTADAGRAFELRDFLARHWPDMADGFSIKTSYGEFRVAPGRLADDIRDLLAQQYMLELVHIEQGERQAKAAAPAGAAV